MANKPNPLVPEWDKLKAGGWKFTYDHETRFFGCEHPDGGKFSIAEFCRQTTEDRKVLANQIGYTLVTFFNDVVGK